MLYLPTKYVFENFGGQTLYISYQIRFGVPLRHV